MISRGFLIASWLAFGVGLGLAIANWVLAMPEGLLARLPLVASTLPLAAVFIGLTSPEAGQDGKSPWAATELRAVMAFGFAWFIPFQLSYLVLNQFGWIDGPATPWIMAALLVSLIVGAAWAAIHANRTKRRGYAGGHGRAATG